MAIFTEVVFQVLEQSSGKRGPFRTRLVTLDALDGLMLAFKLKFGIAVMVKKKVFALPADHVVTRFALVVGDFGFMRNLMTVRALVVPKVLEQGGGERSVLRTGLMALDALEVPVFAFETEL